MTGLDNPVATGGSALLAALFIQYLKNCPWATWFDRETEKANLALSVLVAIITSFGIHVTFDHATGAFGLSGTTHDLWNGVIQWVTQHAAYKGFIVPGETLGEIRLLLARSLTPPPISPPDAKTQEHKP